MGTMKGKKGKMEHQVKEAKVSTTLFN